MRNFWSKPYPPTTHHSKDSILRGPLFILRVNQSYALFHAYETPSRWPTRAKRAFRTREWVLKFDSRVQMKRCIWRCSGWLVGRGGMKLGPECLELNSASDGCRKFESWDKKIFRVEGMERKLFIRHFRSISGALLTTKVGETYFLV